MQSESKDQLRKFSGKGSSKMVSDLMNISHLVFRFLFFLLLVGLVIWSQLEYGFFSILWNALDFFTLKGIM